MAIYRYGPSPQGDYCAVPNSFIRNPSLSGKAKSYLIHIASHAATYDLTVRQIVGEMKDGPSQVESGLKELEAARFLRRLRRRLSDGTLNGYDWMATYDPEGHPLPAEPDAIFETGADQQKHGVSAGGDQDAVFETGPEQGKDGVSAGGDQSEVFETGSDLQEHPVSAGRNQSRFSHPKKTKKIMKEEKQNPTSPYPLDVIDDVVDGEIVEEGEESTSSVEHQVQKLIDEAKAAKPNWSAVEIRQQINALTVTFNGDLDIIGAVVRGTAQDPASAKPSRMTASGNPALVAASQALMLHRLDTSDASFAPAPLRKGAHMFTPDGSGISCAVERCGLPKANGIHVSAESWAARNANAGHPRPRHPNQHVPHLDREDISAYKTSKLYP